GGAHITFRTQKGSSRMREQRQRHPSRDPESRRSRASDSEAAPARGGGAPRGLIIVGLVLGLVFSVACLHRPTPNPNVLVVAIQTGPNNLDPRVATDDASQKIDDLIFDTLMGLDDRMRVTPRLAERLDPPSHLASVGTLRPGVMF